MSLEVELGTGRSGAAYLDNGTVRKDFLGDPFADRLHYVVFGAPNPYRWNEDAVACADYKRDIIDSLVKYWHELNLKVAKPLGTGWNEKKKAFWLRTEFSNGKPASMHTPFSSENEGELSDLTDNVMKPLQNRLIEAGLYGLVWQAGKGNPAAPNNFLLEKYSDGSHKWVWIDLESGVPAMLPLTPSFFKFYLPKWVQYKRPLFDDVDIKKLRAYVGKNQKDLEAKLGNEKFWALYNNITQLEFHQQRWKSMKRSHRAIEYQLKTGKIDEERAQWFKEHTADWYAREIGRISWKSIDALVFKLPPKIARKMYDIDFPRILFNIDQLISNGEYRREVGRDYFLHVISDSESRKWITPEQAAYLRGLIQETNSRKYMADVGASIGIKAIEWLVVVPVGYELYRNGAISQSEFVAMLLLKGSILRSMYSFPKMSWSAYTKIKSTNDKKRFLPYAKEFATGVGYSGFWGPEGVMSYVFSEALKLQHATAFLAGLVPVAGALAYPLEMIYSNDKLGSDLGALAVYHSAAKAGEKVPVVGGRDGHLSYLANRMPDYFIEERRPLELRTN